MKCEYCDGKVSTDRVRLTHTDESGLIAENGDSLVSGEFCTRCASNIFRMLGKLLALHTPTMDGLGCRRKGD